MILPTIRLHSSLDWAPHTELSKGLYPVFVWILSNLAHLVNDKARRACPHEPYVRQQPQGFSY